MTAPTANLATSPIVNSARMNDPPQSRACLAEAQSREGGARRYPVKRTGDTPN